MWQSMLDLEGFVWEGKPTLLGANQENRQLDETLKAKKTELQRLRGTLEMEVDKGRRMSLHFGDLKLEKDYVQRLDRALQKELEVDRNNEISYFRNVGHLKQEIEAVKKELESVKSRQNTRETNIQTQKEKQEALKMAIHLEEDALLQWLADTAQLEKDKLALAKYAQQDDMKFKEINLLIEKTSAEYRLWQSNLNETDTELFVIQNGLDHIQEEFKIAHKDRNEVIHNWEKVLNNLQIRNEEINSLAELLEKRLNEEKEIASEVRQLEQHLNSDINSNKLLFNDIQEGDRMTAALRMQRTEQMKQENFLEGELESVRNVLVAIEHQRHCIVKEMEFYSQQIEEYDKKIYDATCQQEAVAREIANFETTIKYGELNVGEIEKELVKQKRYHNNLASKYRLLANNLIRCTEEMYNTSTLELSKESETKGLQATLRNQKASVRTLESDRIQQKKLMASINTNIKNIETRIKTMEGDMTNEEEKWRMGKEIARMQALLDEKNASLSFLNLQLKALREKIKVAIKFAEMSKNQFKEINERIEFLDYYIGSSIKALNQANNKKKDLLVDQCMTDLQLSRLEKLLKENNDTIIDLKRFQAEFDNLVKNRMLELKTCRDMMNIEMRRLESECHNVSHQVHNFTDKSEKLGKRYEILLMSLGLKEGSNKSESDLLIESEEHKRSLQIERDEMIRKVVDSEDDLHALRNTLLVVQAINEQFREQINPPGLTTEENETLKAEEWEQQKVDVELLNCMKKQQEILDKEEELTKHMSKLPKELLHLQKEVNERQLRLDGLNKDIDDLAVKIERADKSNSRIKIQVQKSELEEDVRAHLLKELQKSVLDQIFTAVSDDRDLFFHLKLVFNKANIPLPPKARNTVPSKSSLLSMSISKLVKDQVSPSNSATVSSVGSSRTTLSPTVVSLGSDL